MKRTPSRWWRYVRGLLPPVLLFCAVLGIIVYTVENRLRDELEFEENILREWILETRVGQETLTALVEQYLDEQGADLEARRDAVETHLTVLGELTRTNQGLLPLFPFVYRMHLRFLPERRPAIQWCSNSPIPRGIRPQSFVLVKRPDVQAIIDIDVQLRAFANRQEAISQRQAQMRHGLSLMAVASALVALLWLVLFLKRERAQELSEFLAREKYDALERERLTEQLKREEEELKRKEAEKQALEARTKLYADISVLAGSYAHNIKNLLVRPNDLLERCLAVPAGTTDYQGMLQEARESLRHVSERTQQILRTVRRDLQESVHVPIHLPDLAQTMHRQWQAMASEQWKLDFLLELDESVTCKQDASVQVACMQGDPSLIQQALENLLCNARDATFEERNYKRASARSETASTALERQSRL
ncbi:MAG TPA: hypothetical protein PKA06_07335, partial [Gemmatales bacterium]|nr:hypothetical protein [Gemmatales bacterium]